jgi:hypothetical protein
VTESWARGGEAQPATAERGWAASGRGAATNTRVGPSRPGAAASAAGAGGAASAAGAGGAGSAVGAAAATSAALAAGAATPAGLNWAPVRIWLYRPLTLAVTLSPAAGGRWGLLCCS